MGEDSQDWMPIPDTVAQLLGRLTFYAAWLDDTLGEAVVLGNPAASALSESTPGWAASGQVLVKAVRGIEVPNSIADQFADRLDRLNASRNQLIHGVWLYEGTTVMVIKRAIGKGIRSVHYATYTYAEIAEVVEEYQSMGRLADRLVSMLMQAHPEAAAVQDHLLGTCPTRGATMGGAVKDDVIVVRCSECGWSRDLDANGL